MFRDVEPTTVIDIKDSLVDPYKVVQAVRDIRGNDRRITGITSVSSESGTQAIISSGDLKNLDRNNNPGQSVQPYHLYDDWQGLKEAKPEGAI